jgi:hypothetical protein
VKICSESLKEECIAQLRKMAYGDQGITMNNEPDIAKVIKVEWLRWLGHLFMLQEQNPCRNLTLHKAENTRRLGRPYQDSVEDDLKTMGVRN